MKEGAFMKKLLGMFLLLVSVHLWADDLQEGIAAYRQKDFGKAFTLLKPYEISSNPEAHLTLAYMYYSGEGIAKDYSKALSLFKSVIWLHLLGHRNDKIST